jgi:hemolysin III
MRRRKELAAQAAQAVQAVKPRLRGWLHAGTFPLALIAGLLLIALGPTLAARLCAAVYALTSVLLFGVSAAYHRGRWSAPWEDVLRRFDHANIYLIIAGTYTPFAALILRGDVRVLVLSVVWAGALAGVLFRVLWVRAGSRRSSCRSS